MFSHGQKAKFSIRDWYDLGENECDNTCKIKWTYLIVSNILYILCISFVYILYILCIYFVYVVYFYSLQSVYH